MFMEPELSLPSAANEPYDSWKGLDRKSQEYQDLKVHWCHSIFKLLAVTSSHPCLPFSSLYVPLQS